MLYIYIFLMKSVQRQRLSLGLLSERRTRRETLIGAETFILKESNLKVFFSNFLFFNHLFVFNNCYMFKYCKQTYTRIS